MIEIIALIALTFVLIVFAVYMAFILIGHLLDLMIFMDGKIDKWRWKRYIRRIK